MSSSPPQKAQTPPPGLGPWLQRHLPVLLYGWFWFGMFLCGILAPPERVTALESGVITQGWHLSLLACLLGGPVLVAYVLRMSKR